MVFRSLRLLGLATIASVGALIASTSAQASLVNNLVSLDPCDNSTLAQPFSPWLDFDYYKLAPGGDGSLTGWSLAGGAQQVSGGEPWNVSGGPDSSLSLPADATAVSPQTCVDAAYPTFRFFSVSGAAGSSAAVSVIYNGVRIKVGVVTPGMSWSPTLQMTTASPLWGILNGGSANIQLQFTGLAGSVQVDDVEVDPFRGH